MDCRLRDDIFRHMVTFVTCEGCGKQILCDSSQQNGTCRNCGKPVYLPPARVQVSVPVQPAVEPPATRACPFCSETIQGTAVKCRHCGEFLDPALRAAALTPSQQVIVSTPVNVRTVQQVVTPRRGFNHGVHLVLTIMTFGLWLPIWILAWLIHALGR